MKLTYQATLHLWKLRLFRNTIEEEMVRRLKQYVETSKGLKKVKTKPVREIENEFEKPEL